MQMSMDMLKWSWHFRMDKIELLILILVDFSICLYAHLQICFEKPALFSLACRLVSLWKAFWLVGWIMALFACWYFIIHLKFHHSSNFGAILLGVCPIKYQFLGRRCLNGTSSLQKEYEKIGNNLILYTWHSVFKLSRFELVKLKNIAHQNSYYRNDIRIQCFDFGKEVSRWKIINHRQGHVDVLNMLRLANDYWASPSLNMAAIVHF